MMTRFVIPFEVAGLLLTAALVGAIALAQLPGMEEPPAASASTGAGTLATNGSGNGHVPTQPEAVASTTSNLR